jgi:hypothetical protein
MSNLIQEYNKSISNNDYKRCNKILEDFSREHHTFINQIFGDQTIRSFIRSAYISRDPTKSRFTFKVKPVDGYEHHILVEERQIEEEKNPEKRKRKTIIPQERTEKVEICSVKRGHQNWNVNVNDMLCQSYSLLAFFEKNIDDLTHEKRQMLMVDMYRGILELPKFHEKLIETIQNPRNFNLWKDYRKDPKNPPDLEMNETMILEGIHKTLEDWQAFGYHYFIGEGTCPGTPERAELPPPEPRITRSRHPIPVDESERNVRVRRGGKKKSNSRKSNSRKSKSRKSRKSKSNSRK